VLVLEPTATAWLSGDVQPGGMHLTSLLSPSVLRALARR
jgi:hypothetical protein